MDYKWFKAQQKKAGVTAEDIAQRMGRSRSNVSHILNGHQRMSLDWAKAFADTLDVSVAEVLERAGVADPVTAQQLRPGFAESDAAPMVQQQSSGDGREYYQIAEYLGGKGSGMEIFRVKSRAMCLAGLLMGDYILVDTNLSERAKAGDVVIAQIFKNNSGTATTVIRRFEPPVLVAASADPDDMRVYVVDGTNVVIRGKVVASWRVA